MSQKTDRKELRQPDEFQVIAGKAMEWLVARQRQLIIAGAALVVIVLAAWGFGAMNAAKEAKAGAALSEALELQSRPIAGEGFAQPGQETFPSKDERQKAVLAGLDKVRAENGGTVAASTAQAEIGFQKLKAGDAAGAQQALQDFLAAASKDHPLRGFAIESLGYAFEAQNKLEDAKQTFLKLTELGLAERASFQAARLALVEGKPDAKAQLEQVAKDYAKDPVAMEANQRLEIAGLPKYEAPPPAPVEKEAPKKAAPVKPAPKKAK